MSRDFLLAFSPERVYSGRIFKDLRDYPKVVGGIDVASTAAAVAFYETVLTAPEVRAMRDAETAELVKLFETTYRDVNIGLANQFARYAARHDLPADEAIAAANTQPYSHIHRPGIGVGGHCIPVYPYFLINDDPVGDLSLPRQARATNDGMVAWALDRLGPALGGLTGRTVLVLGYSYREDVKEPVFSSAKPLIRALQTADARALVCDPLFTPEELAGSGATPVVVDSLPPADAVVIQAFHRAFAALDWAALAARGCRVVFDGRNALDAPARAAVQAAGMAYMGVGR